MIESFKTLLNALAENKKLDRLKALLEDYLDIDNQIKRDAELHRSSGIFGMKTALNLIKKKNIEKALSVIPSDVFSNLGITKEDCVNPLIKCSCSHFYKENICTTGRIRLLDSIYVGEEKFICYSCYFKRYMGTMLALGEGFHIDRIKCFACGKQRFSKQMLCDPIEPERIYCAECFFKKFSKQIEGNKKEEISHEELHRQELH